MKLSTVDIITAIDGYTECALWSESCRGTVEHEDCDGEDCDKSLSHDLNLDESDLTDDSHLNITADVVAFLNKGEDERPDIFEGMNPAQIGHDFWLTRNRHGAGFWDRGLGERGDWLSDIARAYGDAVLEGVTGGKLEYIR
jgi:hypothetical protein